MDIKSLCLSLAMAATMLSGAAASSGAKTYDLVIAEKRLTLSGKTRTAMTINGQVPGPTLHWREGEVVTLRVTNRLQEDTSIHWHGLILPYQMDGVPKISFKGIKPGTTFVYRFKVRQNGTYWYHSHSGLQEQSGVYGSIVIKPAKRDAVRYDREHVIVLSDWTDENPQRVLANLKRRSNYYNQNQPTLVGLINRLRRAKTATERAAIWRERVAWGQMRMDPSDIADVTGMTYTYLMNGKRAALNWTALFKPGERVRLRFINAAAMTYFDVKIPGLKMTVVQADGQDVKPVTVDEFRIAVAETYDVIVSPRLPRAYTIFARAMDRSGFVRGTLAPRRGMSAAVPPVGPPLKLRMAEMGPAGHGGMSGHGGQGGAMTKPATTHGRHSGGATGGQAGHNGHARASAKPMPQHQGHAGHAGMKSRSKAPMRHDGRHAGHRGQKSGAMPARGAHAGHGTMKARDSAKSGAHAGHAGHSAVMKRPASKAPAKPDHKGHGAMGGRAGIPQGGRAGHGGHGGGKMRIHAVGSESQLTRNAGRSADGRYKKLTYGDLVWLRPSEDTRKPGRTIVLRLTGNMERYFWTINDVKYSDAKPIRLRFGERVRIRLVNETMMAHPMHLHGVWSELRNGNGRFNPKKHTVSVGPGQIIEFDVTADAAGQWAFHCHLLLHMETGMFRKVIIANVAATN